jgi:hypothetical protein
MAYVVDCGQARVHTPTTLDLSYNDQGLVRGAVLDTGMERIVFEQDCCSYWPLHTIGRVVEVSGRTPVTDSWTDCEWMPDNADEMWDANEAGRLTLEPGGLHLEGQRIVVPGVIS